MALTFFVYVLKGTASILLEARKHRLEAGSYAYLPSGQDDMKYCSPLRMPYACRLSDNAML